MDFSELKEKDFVKYNGSGRPHLKSAKYGEVLSLSPGNESARVKFKFDRLYPDQEHWVGVRFLLPVPPVGEYPEVIKELRERIEVLQNEINTLNTARAEATIKINELREKKDKLSVVVNNLELL